LSPPSNKAIYMYRLTLGMNIMLMGRLVTVYSVDVNLIVSIGLKHGMYYRNYA